MDLTYAPLKERQREERENYPENLSLRVHRALSWLNRAEQCEDTDGQFIFLWIAFNAAYANDWAGDERPPEHKLYSKFLNKIIRMDKDEVLYELVWQEFSGSVRLLLDNHYVFQPFWDYHNDLIDEQTWQERFARAGKAVNKALEKHDTTTLLSIILSRMYTLRNQMMHGGATWNSAVNRDQLRDCSAFLGKLVPFIIQLMMDHPNALWGDPYYKVVEEQ
jgi:hypothetical protein